MIERLIRLVERYVEAHERYFVASSAAAMAAKSAHEAARALNIQAMDRDEALTTIVEDEIRDMKMALNDVRAALHKSEDREKNA